MLDKLARDVLFYMCTYFDDKSLDNCQFVCASWNKLFSSENLWRYLCTTISGWNIESLDTYYVSTSSSWKKVFIQYIPRVMRNLTWDELKKSLPIAVSNRSEVECTTLGFNSYIIANQSLSSDHKYYFEFIVSEEIPGAWLAIGVIDTEFGIISEAVGKNLNCNNAGYFNLTGAISWTGNTVDMTELIQSGDTVGILVDCYGGRICFTRNSRYLSTIKFSKELLWKSKFYPIVSLGQGSKAKILTNPLPPLPTTRRSIAHIKMIS